MTATAPAKDPDGERDRPLAMASPTALVLALDSAPGGVRTLVRGGAMATATAAAMMNSGDSSGISYGDGWGCGWTWRWI